MKLGLYLAFVVLVASTNVLAQRGTRTRDRSDGNKPVAIVREETKPLAIVHNADEPVRVVDENSEPIKVVNVDGPVESDDLRRRPTNRDDDVVRDKHRSSTGKFNRPQDRDGSRVDFSDADRQQPARDDNRFISKGNDRLPEDRDRTRGSKVPSTDRFDRRPEDQDRTRGSKVPSTDRFDRRPEDQDRTRGNNVPSTDRFDRRPEDRVEQPVDSEEPRPNQGARFHDQPPVSTPRTIATDGNANPVTDPSAVVRAQHVQVSGNIILLKYLPTIVGSVQYDVGGTRLFNGDRQSAPNRLPYAQDFIARQSRVTLYVSTSKTTDRKSAFAQFPIQYQEDHFPLSFDIDVDLPSQQRGLLDRADITLYFFVYITNPETRIDTFAPAGTSQILLQGTNRLVQTLDVYVRASGIEVTGLFRSRFGDRLINPGTSFQVYIVPEDKLDDRNSASLESVGQLTINNVPAMYPIPFSLLVDYQTLKPNIKYYAIGYIFENGLRRLINQEPILVINEQKSLVTPQVVFTVIPSPFILRGSVTRSMPGSFYLQPRSSLILRLHEIGSDTPDIIFKLPEIISLPQVFQVNISQAARFDPSKNYNIRALITDEKNNIYMASLQPIPLPDEFSRLTIPVDDLLYYVQARLQSSSNQPLNYIAGSTAQIFVTESPESPTKPIAVMRVDSIPPDFHTFSIQIPATAIQRDRNYYLVMMIESNGVITHISKILLISNKQPPPLAIQLPVLSLNLVTGVIFDAENRPAQWSSSSYANLFLIDDKADEPDKSVVQVWKIHLENDFPVHFEVQLDFSRLLPDRAYRLQANIENGGDLLEYKPAGKVLALNPNGGIVSDVRIPVQNVKTSQAVRGLIYINDVRGPLPSNSEILVQLSSSPSLTNPSIVDELRLPVDGRDLPVNFTMNLPLNKIDINSIYYFLVQYTVRDNLVIPASQAFAFSPRNEATVVLTLSKTPQIPITGQVTSTGSPLILPQDSTLHLYITDNVEQQRPVIYSEVFLQASSNSLYEFTMNIDSVILQKKIPLYLRADILYDDRVILSIPRPALLQIAPGGEWNINLVIDLPTLLIGRIVSMNQQTNGVGDIDVSIQILERGTNNVVYTSHIRLNANLPQPFRIEIDNDLFARYPALQARAIVKNCKDQVLFESGGAVDIQPGLNLNVDLPVVLTDRKRFSELQSALNEIAPLSTGIWRLSVTGVVSDLKNRFISSPSRVNGVALNQ